jgi:hypothetical protein
VSAGSRQIVLPSDAAHFNDSIELDRPFQVFTEVEGMCRTYERLPGLAAEPSTAVLAGHGPAMMSMFERITDNCVDLTRAGPGSAPAVRPHRCAQVG